MDLNEVRIAQVSALLEGEPDLPEAVLNPRLIVVAAAVVVLDLLALLLILD